MKSLLGSSRQRLLAWGFNAVIALFNTIVTARLLGPESIGVFAKVAVVMTPLIDLHLTGVPVMRQLLPVERFNAVARFNVLAALAIAVLAGLWSLVLPSGTILALFGVVLAASGVEARANASLVMSLRFATVAWISTGGLLMSTLVSVALANRGIGPSSLAAGLAAGAVLRALVAHLLSRHIDLRKGRARVSASLTDVLHTYTVGVTKMIGSVQGLAPQWALAFSGAQVQLGLMSRAQRLGSFAIEVYSAAYGGMLAPVFAQRAGAASSSLPFVRAAMAMLGISSVLVLVGTLFIGWLVPLTLGSAWLSLVPIVRVLLLATTARASLKLANDWLRPVYGVQVESFQAFRSTLVYLAVFGLVVLLNGGIEELAVVYVILNFALALERAWKVAQYWTEADGSINEVRKLAVVAVLAVLTQLATVAAADRWL
jgi:O-antigen/teichoic acid export membrane protein